MVGKPEVILAPLGGGHLDVSSRYRQVRSFARAFSSYGTCPSERKRKMRAFGTEEDPRADDYQIPHHVVLSGLLRH